MSTILEKIAAIENEVNPSKKTTKFIFIYNLKNVFRWPGRKETKQQLAI